MIEQSEDPAIFQAFIKKFTNAPQRQLAELKLMMLPSAPVEPKENSLPETSKTDQLELNESGSDDRYSWTDVVVEDTVKNLIWQRREIGQQTFNGAKEYCEQLQLDGSNEWRLPEIAELRELNSQILPIFHTRIF